MVEQISYNPIGIIHSPFTSLEGMPEQQSAAQGIKGHILIRIELNRLDIENVDIIDGTPLLGIKPYVPEMNEVDDPRIGWLSKNNKEIYSKKSDKIFQ